MTGHRYRIYNRRAGRVEYTAATYENALAVLDNWSYDLDSVNGDRRIEKLHGAGVWVIV